MGSSDGQAAGPVQTVFRHFDRGSGVSLEATGTPHCQDGGLLHCMGCLRRGNSLSCIQSQSHQALHILMVYVAHAHLLDLTPSVPLAFSNEPVAGHLVVPGHALWPLQAHGFLSVHHLGVCHHRL